MDQTNYRTIIHVDKTYLKFLLVKRLKEMLRNKFIKTLLQSQELCLYSSHEPPVHIQPVGEEGKGQGWWAGQHWDFYSRLAKCSFYRGPCFNTHILYYERSAYTFLFHQPLIIAPLMEKPKHHSQLSLPRSSRENIHVIYEFPLKILTSLVTLHTKILFITLFPLHLQDIFLFAIPDIFLLVLFCHWNIPAIWFEFVL